MNEIKVSLSIILPGRIMLSKDECLKTTQEIVDAKNGKKRVVTKKVWDNDKTDVHTMKVTEQNGATPEYITFYTRKCEPASQSLNINKESYDYMVSRDSCPPEIKSSKWAMLNKKARLEAHLQKIMKYLGGISYTYQIFED